MGKRGPKLGIEKINLDKVKTLVEKGFTDAEVADFFDVSLRTYLYWKEKKPEFKSLLLEWKEEADKQVERSLWERANGYSHREDKIFCSSGEIISEETVKHYPPDTTACIFWLKNRHPKKWKDRKDLDLSGELITKVEFSDEDREMIKAGITALKSTIIDQSVTEDEEKS